MERCRERFISRILGKYRQQRQGNESSFTLVASELAIALLFEDD
jgi:hypothetical protein